MSFNSASTVLVFNINTPDATGKAHGGAPVVDKLPGVSQEPPTEEGVIKLGEATPKQNRIQQLLDRVPGDMLQTLPPPPDAASFKGEEAPVPKEGLPQPACTTEQPVPANMIGHADPLALQVGTGGDIPRWRPGSVINFATYMHGYPKKGDAQFATEHLLRAANHWNSKNIGVTFRMVTALQDACFVLGYAGKHFANTLAIAFFPNGNDLNNVLVFEDAFSPGWKPHMWAVFAHELGHVLGLRHEFAMEGEKPDKSVQWGQRDEFSVMNYTGKPPRITENDENNTRAFYRVSTGSFIGGMQVKDWIPDN